MFRNRFNDIFSRDSISMLNLLALLAADRYRKSILQNKIQILLNLRKGILLKIPSHPFTLYLRHNILYIRSILPFDDLCDPTVCTVDEGSDSIPRRTDLKTNFSISSILGVLV